MKTTTCAFFLVLLSLFGVAQPKLPLYPDSIFSTYYQQRVTHFRTLPSTAGDIIFLGNSITDGAEWSELFGDPRIKNRGISGDGTAGVIHRLDEIAGRRPAKVFLLIGINDLAAGATADSIVKNIMLIAEYLYRETPGTKLFVESILPVNDKFRKFPRHTDKGEQIKQVNAALQRNAGAGHYRFIDLYTHFCDANGKLKPSLTNDGLHLKGDGYLWWKHLLYPFVYDLQPVPALIPLPQQLDWRNGAFPLYQCRSIVMSDSRLRTAADYLRGRLVEKGLRLAVDDSMAVGDSMSVDHSIRDASPVIELRTGHVPAPQNPEEAYQLEVQPARIILTANGPHGIFNAIQSLLQLTRDATIVDDCVMTDWPAFSWRGYMVDVGRNYQSVNLLKQQIEMMSRYKLNIFHLHLTEDMAWRLAIPQYPRLTAAENMWRNKGMYYTEEDIKDLIRFCKERFITFVPEIDMPGHSAAFRRAMGVDMQTDSGLMIIRNILRYVCTTFDVPYIHIGADEVKITNKDFVPEVTAYIQSLGRRVIGWDPGGNLPAGAMHQLWKGDNESIAGDTSTDYIDSRNLYLNHMDPLESVVTIFNRQIGDVNRENEHMKGGTICLWNDRAVANENDLLRMNPVYPSMLAFAERVWRGGGDKSWSSAIGDPHTAAAKNFAEFEDRLLDAKAENFSQLVFPYYSQSFMTWNLYGPYDNKGDLSKRFAPEKKGFNEKRMSPAIQATGGTIILRHWWYPQVGGVLSDPKENTTWYATARIWSDETKVQDCWIGFDNLSRSTASDSPPPGGWDNKLSEVWVNGTLILPPQWRYAGRKGNLEEPLVDEGYEYRPPSRIPLRKGWNDILIKAPVGSFTGRNWQNPVKWMFTFVPLNYSIPASPAS